LSSSLLTRLFFLVIELDKLVSFFFGDITFETEEFKEILMLLLLRETYFATTIDFYSNFTGFPAFLFS
jgi:hypothetical protein